MAVVLRPPVPLSQSFPDGYEAMRQLGKAVRAAIDPTLLELVQLRASQINGCAFCLDMHTKDALANGERTDRLAVLPAWRESPGFSEQERAALALTEAITRIADQHVPAEVEDWATTGPVSSTEPTRRLSAPACRAAPPRRACTR
jgi:AhpD family alkylhydroperoxidase